MLQLKTNFKLLLKLNTLARQYFATSKLIDVKINDNTGVATVSMRKPPVNSQNVEFFSSKIKVINELERMKIQGMILTSVCENLS